MDKAAVKESWANARALHGRSTNPRSKISTARAFLSRVLTEGKDLATVDREYDKYIVAEGRSRKNVAKRARRKARKKQRVVERVATTNRTGTSKELGTFMVGGPLLDLFAVKDFIRRAGLTIDRVAAAVDAIRKIENGSDGLVSQKYPSPNTPKGWIVAQSSNDVLLTQHGPRRRVRLADGRTASKQEFTMVSARRRRAKKQMRRIP